MNTVFELILLSGIFLLPYLVLRRDTSFVLQRAYLLSLPLLCLLSFLLPDLVEVEAVQDFSVILPEISAQGVSSENYSLSIFPILWLSVSLFLMGIWFFSLFQLIQLKRNVGKIEEGLNGSRLYFPSKVSSPFSFLGMIFLPTDVAVSSIIIRHEEIHLQKKHTIDLIYFELLTRVFWFNPFFWWMNKAIRKVHEFEVDQQICKESDVNEYRVVLLETTLASNRYRFVHGFKSSLIKNRLHMLKNQKRFSGMLKAGLIVPFLAITIIGFSGRKELSNLTVSDHDFGWSEFGEPQEPDNYPEFEGGMNGMIQFIAGNLVYPEAAKTNGKSGKVMVQFVVTKKGKISKVKVLKGFDEECDAEALRVVKSMPDWKSGTKDGKPVNVEMVLPIQFALN